MKQGSLQRCDMDLIARVGNPVRIVVRDFKGIGVFIIQTGAHVYSIDAMAEFSGCEGGKRRPQAGGFRRRRIGTLYHHTLTVRADQRKSGEIPGRSGLLILFQKGEVAFWIVDLQGDGKARVHCRRHIELIHMRLTAQSVVRIAPPIAAFKVALRTIGLQHCSAVPGRKIIFSGHRQARAADAGDQTDRQHQGRVPENFRLAAVHTLPPITLNN
ncbi:MAG: hypothetical protein BWY83_01898 [bacterium ADurb.Bin478]|nr:MAG: hypothetical protein BWY83_01898 [bacterium ADurb.Bin478]